MFWSKTDREARRQKVLDELIEIEPVDRPSRLQDAVTAGDVRANEVEQALRLVDRLDALRVMSIPHVDGRLRGAAHGRDTETVAAAAEGQPVAAPDQSTAADVVPVPAADDPVSEVGPVAAEVGPVAAEVGPVAAEVQSVASEVPSVLVGARTEGEERDEPASAGRVAGSYERRLVARKGFKAKAGSASRETPRAQQSAAVPIVREPTAVAIEPEMLPTIDPKILAAPIPIDALESAARLIDRHFGAPDGPATRPDDDLAELEPSLAGVGRQESEAAGPSIDWLRP